MKLQSLAEAFYLALSLMVLLLSHFLKPSAVIIGMFIFTSGSILFNWEEIVLRNRSVRKHGLAAPPIFLLAAWTVHFFGY